jgi:hypothetical protein
MVLVVRSGAMRRLLRPLIILAVLLLAAGYLFFEYWPRERTGVPEGLPARLLATGPIWRRWRGWRTSRRP